MTAITGRKAIEMAAAQGRTLHKCADPIEGARSGLTLVEAREIAAVDPSLVYITVEINEIKGAK